MYHPPKQPGDEAARHRGAFLGRGDRTLRPEEWLAGAGLPPAGLLPLLREAPVDVLVPARESQGNPAVEPFFAEECGRRIHHPGQGECPVAVLSVEQGSGLRRVERERRLEAVALVGEVIDREYHVREELLVPVGDRHVHVVVLRELPADRGDESLPPRRILRGAGTSGAEPEMRIYLGVVRVVRHLPRCRVGGSRIGEGRSPLREERHRKCGEGDKTESQSLTHRDPRYRHWPAPRGIHRSAASPPRRIAPPSRLWPARDCRPRCHPSPWSIRAAPTPSLPAVL